MALCRRYWRPPGGQIVGKGMHGDRDKMTHHVANLQHHAPLAS